MFTGTVNFENSKNAHLLKSPPPTKVNISHCENRKFEKCAFFKKSAAHFQKLMFKVTVNFDIRKFCPKIRKMRIF